MGTDLSKRSACGVLVNTVDDIIASISRLSEVERVHFEARLAESRRGPSVPGAADAWRAEIERRLEEVRNGTADTVPAEVVIASARARLAGRRG